jgi:hypothetical protein
LAVGAGLALTLVPFLFPISGQKSTEFLHWPMLLVDRPGLNLLPINAGKRAIALFLINVVGWTLLFVLLSNAFRIRDAKAKSSQGINLWKSKKLAYSVVG